MYIYYYKNSNCTRHTLHMFVFKTKNKNQKSKKEILMMIEIAYVINITSFNISYTHFRICMHWECALPQYLLYTRAHLHGVYIYILSMCTLPCNIFQINVYDHYKEKYTRNNSYMFLLLLNTSQLWTSQYSAILKTMIMILIHKYLLFIKLYWFHHIYTNYKHVNITLEHSWVLV